MKEALHGPRVRASAWWHARAPRERWMLVVMFAAVAAFAAWFGLLAPLDSARERAADRHAAAIQARAEAGRGLAAIAAAAADRPAPPPADRIPAVIADTAGAAGVGLDRQETAADGGLDIGIDAVTSEALLAWLDALRLEHGIAPVAVDIERRDGRLRARVRFGPPA